MSVAPEAVRDGPNQDAGTHVHEGKEFGAVGFEEQRIARGPRGQSR